MGNTFRTNPPRSTYVVVNMTKRGKPTVYHHSLLAAKQEATRLSKQQPGSVFSVLLVCDSVRTRPVTEMVTETLTGDA